MTCELNTNSLRILTVVCGDPNRLTALTNNYLAEPQGAPIVEFYTNGDKLYGRPLSRFPTLEKGNFKLRLVYSYRFGNYLTKNKLYRVDMDLFIKLPPRRQRFRYMDSRRRVWLCGKAVYKVGKVNKHHSRDEQMCQQQWYRSER